MSDWTLAYEGFDPDREGLREALCTLGNGYFATRGALAQARAGGAHYPGTYLAGGYDRLTTEIQGRLVENEDLVNMPNWLPLTFRAACGEWFSPERDRMEGYRQELDIRRGLLTRSFRAVDAEGRATLVAERRLVHMGDKHLAALELTLTPENWSGSLGVLTELDGSVRNSGVPRYRDLDGRHLEPLSDWEEGEVQCMTVRTRQSRIEVALSSRLRAWRDGERVEPEGAVVRRPGVVGREFAVDIKRGGSLRLEKVVALYSSRDRAISEPGLESCKAVHRVHGFEDLVRSHERVWQQLWNRFDVEFELTGDARAEDGSVAMPLRLNTFHLLQTVSHHTMDLDTGLPARGWHGEGYRGHIFWDELFIFPLLNFRLPEITRALLTYRFRRLDEARAAARIQGLSGAMFPWQSGSNGREENQSVHLNPASGRWLPDNTHLQRHVNSAIAYNVVQYYQVTGDMEFLAYRGAEMLLEIARFWASKAEWDKARERWIIRRVMGPDEFHDAYPGAEEPGLDNNAYTNVMASWVLEEALNVLYLLPEERASELCQKLELDDEEFERWREVSARLLVPFHGDGIISQFEGYEDLEEFDWDGYREKYGDIARLDRILEAEGDTPNRYKASKQADVLMLFYLFPAEELQRLLEKMGYAYDPELIPRNVDYYRRRTSHGSTLSKVVHSRVLARSDRARSWRLFHQALRSDLDDVQGGTTPEGIHTGAMAGSVDIVQRGYTDLEPRRDVLHLNPCIPEEVSRLRLNLRYRKHELVLEIGSRRMRITAKRTVGPPIRLAYEDEEFELGAGESRVLDLKPSSHSGDSDNGLD